MKNRKIVIAAILLAVIMGVMGLLWMSSRDAVQSGLKHITVTVIHSDGTEKVFDYRTDAEYLGDVLLSENLVEGENSEFGMMILSVDQENASWEENHSYWGLYVGTEYATTGADGVVLTDGGEYSLVYTIG